MTTKKIEFKGGDFVINTKNGKFARVGWYRGGTYVWIMYHNGSRNVGVHKTLLVHAPYTSHVTDKVLASAILQEHDCEVDNSGSMSLLRSNKYDTSVAWVSWHNGEMNTYEDHDIKNKDLPALLWALAFFAEEYIT